MKMMKAILTTVAAALLTAAVMGLFNRIDALAKNQSDIRERLVRIETILEPTSPHVQFTTK